jgi:hypothetical protein
MIERVLHIALICGPVFLMLGLGRYFASRGHFGPEARQFATWLVWHFSLPSLIISAIAPQDFGQLLNAPVIIAGLGGTLLAALLGAAAARWAPPPLRGPTAVAPFWANLSYLGFPLAQQAFGPTGLAIAGIVNAFTMPFFVAIGTASLVLRGAPIGDGKAGNLRTRLRPAFCNPVVLAAVLGLTLAGLRSLLGAPAAWPTALTWSVDLAGRTLALLGSLGLPLALLCVGAELDLRRVRGQLAFLTYGSVAKLLLTPAATLAIFLLAFPDAPAAHRGTTVLLMATPTAVGAYVVSRQLDRGADAIASLVVASTLASLLSIPLWLLVLL